MQDRGKKTVRKAARKFAAGLLAPGLAGGGFAQIPGTANPDHDVNQPVRAQAARNPTQPPLGHAPPGSSGPGGVMSGGIRA
jgi:hypothetical protein